LGPADAGACATAVIAPPSNKTGKSFDIELSFILFLHETLALNILSLHGA
jgi:hypothetical protein